MTQEMLKSNLFTLGLLGCQVGFVLLPALLLGWLGVFGRARNSRISQLNLERSAGPETLRVLFVIPAKDEALQIPSVWKTLASQSDLEEVRGVVIADHCNDQTAQVARTHGFDVWENLSGKNRGKSAALSAFLEGSSIWKASDLIVILDADCLLDPQFVKELRLGFSNPSVEVAQCDLQVSNPCDNWRSAVLSYAYLLIHRVRGLARTRRGVSTSLVGNGMAFRTSVFETLHWPLRCRIEDLEISIRIILSGKKIHYFEAAQVYTEAATTSSQAVHQRKNWELGRGVLLFYFILPLFRSLFKRELPFALRRDVLEMAIELFVPPLSLLCFALVLVFLIGCAMHSVPMLGLSALSLAGICVYLLAGLSHVQAKAGRLGWLHILFSLVRFFLWKCRLYLSWILRTLTLDFRFAVLHSGRRTLRNVELIKHREPIQESSHTS